MISSSDANTPGSLASGGGFLTPDAGPDTSRADYSDTAPDMNDALHDDENVDVPGPDDNAEPNVADRQLGIIGRTAG